MTGVQTCALPICSGWLMSVDITTGGPPKNSLFDSNNDGVVDYNDDINGDVAVGQKLGSIPADSSFIGSEERRVGRELRLLGSLVG